MSLFIYYSICTNSILRLIRMRAACMCMKPNEMRMLVLSLLIVYAVYVVFVVFAYIFIVIFPLRKKNIIKIKRK